jgi:phosphoglycolate phosphatase-like HAD superfamily hydrolase
MALANGAVVLDVDGTLIDSNDAHARAWVDAFAEHGITVPFAKIRRAIGMGGDKLLPHVAGIEEDSAVGRAISERRGDIFKRVYLPHLEPFPRVRELLERFRADELTLTVASSARENELRPLLEAARVADLIHAQTSSDEADRSKPDPDIVHAAIARAKCPRDRIVMLGDTPYDVAAAHRAGIPIVALECGGWSAEELRDADAVYASPADLLSKYTSSLFAGLSPSARTF